MGRAESSLFTDNWQQHSVWMSSPTRFYFCYYIGRPFPLKGRYYANIFLHFEPRGHTERFNDRETRDASLRAKERYVHALAKPSSPSQKYDIPDYIQAGSVQEKKWKQEYIFQAVEPVRENCLVWQTNCLSLTKYNLIDYFSSLPTEEESKAGNHQAKAIHQEYRPCCSFWRRPGYD